MELTKTLAQQFHSTYQNLLPHLTDLPTHLQDRVIRIHEGMEEIQSSFQACALKDLPACFAIRQKLASARETLDELIDFVISTPQGQRLSQVFSSNAGKSQPSMDTNQQTIRLRADCTFDSKASDSSFEGECSVSLQPSLPPPEK